MPEAAPQRASATLAAPVRLRIGSRLYEVVFEPVPTEGDVGLSIGVVVDLRDITGGAYLHGAIAGGAALATLLLAVLCGRALSSRIARPIVAIAGDLAKVGAFSISREPAPRSFVREVSELGASVDRMKASLRSFARYVPTDLVRTLLARGQEAELGGEIRRLTIHFSDVADFTAISEGMEPTRLVAAMGRYFELMAGTITRHGGTVDKFMGDGIMAFFNAPEELRGHPRQACLAALEAQELLAASGWRARRRCPANRCSAPASASGWATCWSATSARRSASPTPCSATRSILASRLEGLNKIYGTADHRFRRGEGRCRRRFRLAPARPGRAVKGRSPGHPDLRADGSSRTRLPPTCLLRRVTLASARLTPIWRRSSIVPPSFSPRRRGPAPAISSARR